MQLPRLPGGNLCLERLNGRDYPCRQWTEDTGQKRRHLLAAEDLQLKMELKQRQFIKRSIPILRRNVAALTRCIDTYKEFDPERIRAGMGRAYQTIPDLRSAEERAGEEELWQKLKEGQNGSHPERLIHSIGEKKVRSKSEMIIAMRLEALGIPFKYEVKLQEGNTILCPDFVVYSRALKKIFYWEHFGMTASEEYMTNGVRKLGVYRSMGITLWDNLIVTFDKPDGSIDALQIDKVMKLFLCA